MKNVLILSGSPRLNGNTDMLYNGFMRGVQESRPRGGETATWSATLGRKMPIRKTNATFIFCRNEKKCIFAALKVNGEE